MANYPNTAPPAKTGVGNDGSLSAATAPRLQSDRGTIDGTQVVKRRHIDYTEHQIRWRFLLDSYEGGERYRNAVYGQDRRGMPIRNLLRHRREYPDPQLYPNDFSAFAGGLAALNPGTPMVGGGSGPFPGQLGADPNATAFDDDYELRRSRTPVPEFVAEAVETHLGKVYAQEVTRDGPPDLKLWWEDVDGKGTPLDDWMRETVAPLLVVLGQLDIGFDHPKLPDGAIVNTRADEIELGLDRCIAYHIMPENMVWWRTDRAGRYLACLVREYVDPSDRVDTDSNGNVIDTEDKGKVAGDWRRQYVRYRLWTDKESILYSCEGSEIVERTPHNFGRVPIVRLIDQKKHRCPNVGKSRYEAIAEYQREFYNRDSELILSDILQAHPLLSGPEDYCKADNTMSVGPGYVLPKKKNPESGAYEGWEYTSPPKDPAASLRQNKLDLIDMKDRRAGLTKPAGSAVAGSTGGSVTGQSGLAKQLDNDTGHKLLSGIAKALARAERQICEFALLVIRGVVPDATVLKTLKLIYPSTFGLMNADEISSGLSKVQTAAKGAGTMPTLEAEAIKKNARQLVPGMEDTKYAQMDEEIDRHVQSQAERRPMNAERGIEDQTNIFRGEGADESAGGIDPSGQSGSTSVGNYIPASVQ